MRLFKVTFFIVFLIFAFSSCTLQKRLYNKGFYLSNQSVAKKTNEYASDSHSLINKDENALPKNKKNEAFAQASEETTREAEKTPLRDSIEIKKEKTAYTNFYPSPTSSKKDVNKIKDLRNSKKRKQSSEPDGSNPFAIVAFVLTILGLLALSGFIALIASGGLAVAILVALLTIGLWIPGVILSILSFAVAASNDFKPIKNHILGIIAFGLNILAVATIFILLTKH
jgi:hypothetical protein